MSAPLEMLRHLFKRKNPDRVLAHQSTREITDKKNKLQCELRAAVYYYDNSKFIICSIADIVEYGEPIVLDSDVPDQDLGLALCDSLLNYQRKYIPPKNKEKSKWRAFAVSGEKTVKAFESKSYYVYVRTVNTAIQIVASPRVSNDQNLSTIYEISNGRMHIEIGAAVRKAIKAAMVLRENGVL